MDKYYVRCGELEKIVLADSPQDAAWKSVLQAQGETLWDFFYIDLRGFRGPIVDTLDHTFVCDTEFLPKWTIPYEEIVDE